MMQLRFRVSSHTAGLSSDFAASHVQDGEDHQLHRRTSEEENNQSQKQKVLLLFPPAVRQESLVRPI